MKAPKTVEAPAVVCGVYALLLRDRITYVGKSLHIHRRLAIHQEKWRFDSAVILEVNQKHLDAVEQFLIKLLNPPWNRKHAKAQSGPLHHKRILSRLLPIAERHMAVLVELTKGHLTTPAQ